MKQRYTTVSVVVLFKSNYSTNDRLFAAELLVGILYNQSNISTVYVNEGRDLFGALSCGVSPDTTGYNDALRLNWKRAGKSIPFLTDGENTTSQISDGQQKLYIRNVSADEEGRYVCEYTAPDTHQMSTVSVEILVNGAYDCLMKRPSFVFCKSLCSYSRLRLE